MIVTIAAWLYILDAMLITGSLLWSAWGFNGIEGLVTLAFACLLGAMGIGLLKRLAWARWLALGSSLVGWVFGSVLLLVGASYLGFVAPALLYLWFAGGVFSFIGVLVLLALLLWIVSVVINYKLFWFLCSEEGCAQFGVPPGSAQAVIASAATWIGIFILNGMASGGGPTMSAMLASGQDESPAARELAQREASGDDGEESPVPAEEAGPGEETGEGAGEAGDEAAGEDAGENAGENYSIEESPVPPADTTAPDADSEDESPMQILKCIDASGSTIFTQGYCPPGSKPVRTPARP